MTVSFGVCAYYSRTYAAGHETSKLPHFPTSRNARKSSTSNSNATGHLSPARPWEFRCHRKSGCRGMHTLIRAHQRPQQTRPYYHDNQRNLFRQRYSAVLVFDPRASTNFATFWRLHRPNVSSKTLPILCFTISQGAHDA